MTFTPDVEPEVPAAPKIPAAWMWIVAAVSSGLMIAASVIDKRFYPGEPLNPASVAGILLCMAGHGLFVAADLRRRGRPGRAWGVAGALCPVFVLWIYLAAEYRLHAFWQIPLSVFIYLVVLGWVPAVIGGG